MGVGASIASGLTGGLSDIAGGIFQGKGIQKAAETQAASVDKALNFTKQQYSDLQGRLAPYQQSGQSANQLMSQLVQSSPYAQRLRASMQPQAPAAAAPEPTVLLRAPDGTQRAIPQSLVAKATQAGAVPVNG